MKGVFWSIASYVLLSLSSLLWAKRLVEAAGDGRKVLVSRGSACC